MTAAELIGSAVYLLFEDLDLVSGSFNGVQDHRSQQPRKHLNLGDGTARFAQVEQQALICQLLAAKAGRCHLSFACDAGLGCGLRLGFKSIVNHVHFPSWDR